MAFAAPLAAEAAPAIAGAAEGSAAAGAASEGAASTAGSAAAGKAATKTKAPSAKKPSSGSKSTKAAETGAETIGFSEASNDLMGKKSSKPSKPSKSVISGKKFFNKVGNRKVLLPELISCLVVLVFGTLVAPKGSKDDVHRLLVKGSALMGVFFVLAIISTGGKGAQKFTNVLGLLITLSYLLNSSDIHNIVNWVNSFFGKPKGGSTTKTPPSESESAPPFDTGEEGTLPGPPSMEV